MQATSDDNSIMLVRSAPVAGAAANAVDDATRVLGKCTGEVVVFFHGSGADHATPAHSADWRALSGQSRLTLEVCSVAWQRRHSASLPAPFKESSLVRFWHRLAMGYRIPDQAVHASRESSPSPWMVRIDSRPADPGSREMLELVLAGASLELPIVIVFTGEGRQHLVGGQARQWQQLVDFDLARLHVLANGGFRPELEADIIDKAGLERLSERSRGILVL